MRSSTKPTRLTKVIINKVHGGRKKDSKFWKDDIEITENFTNPEIKIDNKQKTKRRRIKIYDFPVVIIAIAIISVVLARPDLFPFLDYHKIYKTLNKIEPSKRNEKINNITHNETKKFIDKKKQVITVRYKEKEPVEKRYSTKKYETNNHTTSSSKISLAGSVFSWKDENGKRHFSNTNFPAENPTLQVQTEINTYRKITRVHIDGNSIYVPVTLKNNGFSYTSWMLLDTGCSITSVPYTQLNRINADYNKTITLVVADGRKTNGRISTIDLIQIGSQRERNFKVAGTKVAGSDNRGLLGLDFLKRRPFKIDYDKKMLVWM